MKYKLLIIILLALGINIKAQNLTSYSDKNYKEEVRTVLLHPKGADLEKPVIYMYNMKEKLHLQFDVLVDDAPYLYYTFIHCDNNWQPSDLQKNDYIKGFFQDEIDQFTFSLNTFMNYVHYDLVFPKPDMMPKISGNYLLVVTGEDPDDVYFTRRFYVVEDKAKIAASIPRYPFDLSLGTNKQEVVLDVYYKDIFNSRAEQYSNVTIQQNGRWDNAVFGLKPAYVYPEKLTYINNAKTVFESGNQFLRINTSSFTNLPEKTKFVHRDEDLYVVTLHDDAKRNTIVYSEDEDLFGEKYIYLERNSMDVTKEGDYALVDFFLKWPQYMLDRDVFIIGAITDWQLDEKSKMEYDPERRGYKKRLLLKQGYYDYMYAVCDNTTGITSVAPVNGDFWETNNMYHIFVYLFDPTENYDKLIGYTAIKAH
ncbi:MAG: DUF5103 domain-containing protein [Bacteroidales bacterium]|nr:DUF5103 domain-containing protein [Bacteroidales bacterium]